MGSPAGCSEKTCIVVPLFTKRSGNHEARYAHPRPASKGQTVLYTAGYLGETFYVPFWVVLSAHAAIGLGTYLRGWKVVRTMGMKLTHLTPVGGFCAETASAIMLFGTAAAGIPVSTTHTIAGAIVGVGSTRRISAVRWGIAGKIVVAWIITIPAAAFVAGFSYYLIDLVRRIPIG